MASVAQRRPVRERPSTQVHSEHGEHHGESSKRRLGGLATFDTAQLTSRTTAPFGNFPQAEPSAHPRDSDLLTKTPQRAVSELIAAVEAAIRAWHQRIVGEGSLLPLTSRCYPVDMIDLWPAVPAARSRNALSRRFRVPSGVPRDRPVPCIGWTGRSAGPAGGTSDQGEPVRRSTGTTHGTLAGPPVEWHPPWDSDRTAG